MAYNSVIETTTGLKIGVADVPLFPGKFRVAVAVSFEIDPEQPDETTSMVFHADMTPAMSRLFADYLEGSCRASGTADEKRY